MAQYYIDLSINVRNQLARAKAAVQAPVARDVEELAAANSVLIAKVNELSNALEDKKKFDSVKARQILEAAIEKHGIEPADELLRMVADGECSVAQKIQILMELNTFRIPKMKTSEVKHSHDYSFNVAIQTFDARGGHEIVDVTPRKGIIEG